MDGIKEVNPRFPLNKVRAFNKFLAHSYIAPESLDEMSPHFPYDQAYNKGKILREWMRIQLSSTF